VVLLERLLRTVDAKLLTFPFHLKSGTDVFTPYPRENRDHRGTVLPPWIDLSYNVKA